MTDSILIADRPVRRAQINHVNRLVLKHPDWERRRLELELCGDWNWRNERGHPKLDACRRALDALNRQGKLQGLPCVRPIRRSSKHEKGKRWAVGFDHDDRPLEGCLNDISPVQISTVYDQAGDLQRFRHLLSRYHPAGFRGPAGENMPYLCRTSAGRPLACLLFGASAWRCVDRDRWIGWSDRAREANLTLTTNNTRFLILPWVKIPHLASHLLGRVCQRLNQDWRYRYGHHVHLLETFVDVDHYKGTCYSAAGWESIGMTQGRGRNQRSKLDRRSCKAIYVRPMNPEFKKELCNVPA
jgi:hypothetical protein